ncbi:transglutaminase-like cysteine peptidase [Rhodobacter sp. HX-7-19]|uniref:Transglutaminase-like cysteine peptidase n=1 Tax=Paragemmobacter kunshanensis TaxID=2583234 RepID=A0A6M1U738_9RHOB|nr:transglutaminase-like cysteine peptidase [Rhodobacter kunshanensis]NGQ89651.1 transglutaminase-like cysteine peptidase [Rhodobacter kunshanensis]
MEHQRARTWGRRLGITWLAFVAGISATMPALSIDARRSEAQLIAFRGEAHAPPGAAALCDTYAWACMRSGKQMLIGEDTLSVVRAINSRANRSIRPVTDVQQYRVAERWSLPTARGGDCEDYALYKKQALIKAGIPAEQLLIATVLDRKRQSHAVLVLRTGAQDLVLDNMTNRILSWEKTGYTFLRLQDPRQPSRWVSVLAGGMFPDS